MRGFLVAASAAVAFTAPAHAQRFDDTVTLKVEAYFAGVDSFVRVGLPERPGTGIDMEDVLGLDDSATLPAVQIGWRANDDWVFNAEYYRLGRRSQKTLDREIVVGDTTYPVSATVGAGFDSDIYRFTAGALLFQRERLELGIAAGFHGTNFKLFVEGQGSVGEQQSQVRREGRSIFAPLPTVGAFGQWEPANRLTISGRIDWLSLGIDDYSGRLINTEAAASYRIQKHIDVGLLYRYVDYKLKIDKDNWNGRVAYKFSGPAVFARVGF
ncbi:outer membrane beta-barrel protein [Sandaracinobacteroides hominis]|uniref:outer membrane beta-barrel protein n=1 Tax=Sandaracinobacteroides hominis TaxID=2780086 RepID=UPI0018F6CF9B|nr:outer membrane beta-barrel protein [Sandaracinobacteroides hominis]